jgi:hypothetical protein
MYHSHIRVRALFCSAQSRLTCCLLHTLLRSTYTVVRPHSLTRSAESFIDTAHGFLLETKLAAIMSELWSASAVIFFQWAAVTGSDPNSNLKPFPARVSNSR